MASIVEGMVAISPAKRLNKNRVKILFDNPLYRK